MKTNETGPSKKTILLLFFASGISGLIYEVVWLRIVSRIVGVTTYATAITLAGFMAGLALGSFAFGKLADKRSDQLRIFALLQISAAFFAVITPLLLTSSIPLYKYVYDASNHNELMMMITRTLVPFICLLAPTMLMGGTLPMLTSYVVGKEGLFGRNFSLLYGLNTLGAVAGVIVSGFVTIGSIGEWNTIFIGVLINLIVGCVAYLLHSRTTGPAEAGKVVEDRFGARAGGVISAYPDSIRKIVLAAILISGFTALAYEVIWTRQLILFLKTSTYAFSAMLAVFLTGIAVGSIVINKSIDKFKNPLVVFGALELLIGLLSIFNLYLFGPLDSRLLTRLLAPVVLVLPLTLLFGAIFPIASLCYTKSADTTGSSVGTVFGFNTIGNVAGSLLTGFVLISILGSSKTVVLLGFVNIALGVALLWSEPSKSMDFKLKILLIIPGTIMLLLGLKGRDPFLGVIAKRVAHRAHSYRIFDNRETVEGTVTSFSRNGAKLLWINGQGQTVLSTQPKLMAHLPIMLADEPEKILIICFGMGTTLKSASIYDNLAITCVELAPEVYKCFRYYHGDSEEILNRPNVHLVVGDGRNFLLLSSDKYDVITVDPSPPIYNAGTVNLYTREFLSLCREHLTPNGVMCLWFPGRSTRQDRQYIVKTFYSVFPDTTVWKGCYGRGLYIIGTLKEANINQSKTKLAFTNVRLTKDLSEYDKSCVTSSQLLELLFLQTDEQIEDFTRAALIITDNHPYTEFPLWRYLLNRRAGARVESPGR